MLICSWANYLHRLRLLCCTISCLRLLLHGTPAGTLHMLGLALARRRSTRSQPIAILALVFAHFGRGVDLRLG